MKFKIVVWTLVISSLFGAESAKEKKILVNGTITSLDEGVALVKTRIGNKSITFSNQNKWGLFVGFKSMNMNVSVPQVGYFVRSSIDAQGKVKNAVFAPPTPEFREIPEKHTLSVDKIFEITDVDSNGLLDYSEYSSRIAKTDKHQVVGYPKNDKDKDGYLNKEELANILETLDWWKYSRKTSEQWVGEWDNDKTGELEVEEVAALLRGHHTDHEKIVRELDFNQSGGLSAIEFQGYLDRKILKVKTNNSKKKK